LTATLLIVLVAMGLRATLFSPPTVEAVNKRILDYSTARGWVWERRARSSARGSRTSLAARAMDAVTGHDDETGFHEYEFSDGTGSIVVRVEHDSTLVKRIDITAKGVPAGTAEKLRQHLKSQPGWAPCQLHQE
jgi:hypothetical protein